jgi:hypothetical protein
MIMGIGMILYWLFGGFILGMWMTFGSWEILTDLALIKLFGGPSAVLSATLTSALITLLPL